MISFISGNANKFNEIASVLRTDLVMHAIDLDELQELDTQKIIEHKLNEASKQIHGEILIEDTSLYLHCLPNLPGPLIKWFLQSLGNDGLYELAKKYGDFKAKAQTVLGYRDEQGKIEYFTGECFGTIVPPNGETDFGWDPIFVPQGHDKSFALMFPEEKRAVSMRTAAVEKLNNYLNI